MRSRRTDKLIQNAFIKLVNEKGFDSVTITEISSVAMINRLTFYQHYEDKQDLARIMIAGFIDAYDETIQKRLILSQKHLSVEEILAILTPDLNQLFLDNREQIKALKSIQIGSISLNHETHRLITKYFGKFAKHNMSELEKKILFALFGGLFDYTIEAGRLPTAEELRQTFADVAKFMH